jgi:hypothetical protein
MGDLVPQGRLKMGLDSFLIIFSRPFGTELGLLKCLTFKKNPWGSMSLLPQGALKTPYMPLEPEALSG